MNPIYYLIFFTIYFFVSLYYISKKDIFFAAIYLFLFVYFIFAVIGYVYLPELSMILHAYFGTEIIDKIFIFVILSFISFGLFFLLFEKKIVQNNVFQVLQGKDQFVIFTIIYLLHIFYQGAFLYINWDIITYENAGSEDFSKSQGLGYLLFVLQFKHLMIPLNLILYIRFRIGKTLLNHINSKLTLLMWVLHFSLLIFISNRNGSRTDLLSLFIDIVIFEYISQTKLFYIKFKYILKYLMYFLVLIIIVSITPGTRDISRPEQLFYEKILFQDYFPPAHILFAAIANDYISPLLVIQSNFCNALFKLDFPYLQSFIMETFYPIAATRNSSMAFYIFTEGFMVLGWFGFAYNGLILILGATFWRRLASSNNQLFNMFILSFISGRVTTIVRGQSSYFLKDFYTFFIPAIFLFYLATGLYPKIVKILFR